MTELKLYTIYVRNELQPYQVKASCVRDAIFIMKGKLIEHGYPSEIVKVTVDDEFGCTDSFINISIKVTYDYDGFERSI